MPPALRDSPRRLVLWDVDGTLLSAGSVAREAFAEAVEEVLGRPLGEHGGRMSGKTDPQIAREILETAGIPEHEVASLLPAVLEALVKRLERGANRIRREGRVHPGVREILERLSRAQAVVQSVLTGNLAVNARLKVSALGLERFLDLEVGAFGSDHHDRDELIPIALRRVERRYGQRLPSSAVWVVGDTPRDVACAAAGGARCLLVATGRFQAAELEGLGADHVVPDLADVDRVTEILLPPWSTDEKKGPKVRSLSARSGRSRRGSRPSPGRSEAR